MPTVNRAQRGSALILVPICMLLLLSLGGFVIDSATTYYEQRELNDTANSLANRIATKAIDLNTYYGSDGQTIQIDDAKAVQMALTTQNGLSNSYLTDVVITPSVNDAVVSIKIAAIAHHVILRSFPGASNSVPIQATARAELVRHA